MLKGPLASLERHDRPAFEGRSGSERSTEPGSSAKTVASQPVVGYRIRSRTAKKEILVDCMSMSEAYKDLKKLSREELIKKHDAAAEHTQVDVNYYLVELRHRELLETLRPRKTQESHDFDWVTAKRRCTFVCKEQVDLFREDVRMSVERRIKNITSEDERRTVLLDFDDTEEVPNVDAAFKVCKKFFPDCGDYEAMILFEVVGDRIEVYAVSPAKKIDRSLLFEVTMTLNASGEERYETRNIKVPEFNGTFLRWQVIKMALENLYV